MLSSELFFSQWNVLKLIKLLLHLTLRTRVSLCNENVYFEIGSALFREQCRLAVLWHLIFAERQNSWWLWQIILLSALIQVRRYLKAYDLDCYKNMYNFSVYVKFLVRFLMESLLCIICHLSKNRKVWAYVGYSPEGKWTLCIVKVSWVTQAPG